MSELSPSLSDWPKRLALLLIRGYQLTLSPYIGRQCRFYPSCSHYAMEAIDVHGLIRGTGLALRRLGRCHPFHPGGVDVVPAASGVSADGCGRAHHHEES